MSSVKIVLRKKMAKDKTFPLAIRITKNRKTSFIHTGHYVGLNDWDAGAQRVKKSHPNCARLNNYLIKKLAEVNNTALELETQKDNVSAGTVKRKLKSTAGASFFTQADAYLDTLKKLGKFNQHSSNKPRIGRFREFLKKEDIVFQDITVPLLERYKVYLKVNRKRTVRKENEVRPITDRTVVNHLATIRSVFGFAVKAGIIEKHLSPFGSDKVVIKFPPSLKIGLNEEEVKRLEELNLSEGSVANHARNAWLVSFYFAGMRVSDLLLLKWSAFQDDRMHYAMGKNQKVDSLKVPQKVLDILKQYKRESPVHDLVFPDLEALPTLNDKFETQKGIALADRRINEALQEKVAPLAGIDKVLTMHIARHTFGNISRDKIDVRILQRLYRHSSILTTIGYQSNFIHNETDDALNAVVGF